VRAAYAEVTTDVRDLPSASASSWPRYLSRDHDPPRRVGVGVSDKEGILTDLFEFCVGEVRGVSASHDFCHDPGIRFLREKEGGLHLIGAGPAGEFIVTVLHLLPDLDRDRDPTRVPHLLQPCPELWYPL